MDQFPLLRLRAALSPSPKEYTRLMDDLGTFQHNKLWLNLSNNGINSATDQWVTATKKMEYLKLPQWHLHILRVSFTKIPIYIIVCLEIRD